MSKNTKPVTENDFRLDKFKGKNPDDYEFRDDGKIVRKDRFETGIFQMARTLGSRDFEIDDLVRMVAVLVKQYPSREYCECGKDFKGSCTNCELVELKGHE